MLREHNSGRCCALLRAAARRGAHVTIEEGMGARIIAERRGKANFGWAIALADGLDAC